MCVPGSVTHLTRGIRQWRGEQKAFSFTPFLAWSHGPTAGGQMSGVPVPSSRARVDRSSGPHVHVRKAREPFRALGKRRKRKVTCPCGLNPEAAWASPWHLPTRHRRKAVLGPRKTRGIESKDQVLLQTLSPTSHVVLGKSLGHGVLICKIRKLNLKTKPILERLPVLRAQDQGESPGP